MMQFFAELRRRKVIRAAIAYAIFAWVVIQIADVIFDPLHLPEWALTLLIAAVAAGLPLVVIGAWLFDLGPEGLARDAGAHDASNAPRPAANSVAVLPFADLSAEGDQAYFCDGIVEEIINTLARVDGLSVASRWSTQPYRDRPVSVQALGQELKVAQVLEGTVRKSARPGPGVAARPSPLRRTVSARGRVAQLSLEHSGLMLPSPIAVK